MYSGDSTKLNTSSKHTFEHHTHKIVIIIINKNAQKNAISFQFIPFLFVVLVPCDCYGDYDDFVAV